MRPDGPRPKIIGSDSGPEPPFPLRMKGKVVSGFGRGSKEVCAPHNRQVENISLHAQLTDASQTSSASQPPISLSKECRGSRTLNQESTSAGQASSFPLLTRHIHRQARTPKASPNVTNRVSYLQRSVRQGGDYSPL
jgi:hypothetical protein